MFASSVGELGGWCWLGLDGGVVVWGELYGGWCWLGLDGWCVVWVSYGGWGWLGLDGWCVLQ